MAIDVTDLKTAFGKAIGTPASRKDIDVQFMVMSETEAAFGGLTPTDKTQVRRMKAEMDRVLQAFQAIASPVASLALKPRSMDLQDLKYEVELDPDVLEDSYATFLANPDNNDRSSWTITQFVINELMINKGREEFELKEVYSGIKAAIVSGVASAAGAGYNGLGKYIADNIANFNLVAGPGTWSTDPVEFVTQIEDWIEDCCASSEINRQVIENMVDKLCMSKTLAKRYRRGVKAKYNVEYKQVTDPMVIEDNNNIQIVGLPSMNGKNRVFMTFAANRAAYIKRPKSESEIGISMANPYKPMLYAKFWKALGFWHPEYVYVNQLA